jgi:hypothetical protein
LAEENKPDFTVVDRRRATEDAAEDAAPEQTEAAPVEQAEPAAASQPEQAAPEAESGGEEPFVPDPAMLLTFSAAQIETRDLTRLLVAIFDSHAWRNMGLIADPASGEPKEDLAAAQLAIDCVQFLLGKVEKDFSESERREAQRRLSDLRMNYVTKARS